jgi:hypothetical protein
LADDLIIRHGEAIVIIQRLLWRVRGERPLVMPKECVERIEPGQQVRPLTKPFGYEITRVAPNRDGDLEAWGRLTGWDEFYAAAVEYAEQRVTQGLPAESSIVSILRQRYGLERETAMEVFRAAVDRIERRRSGVTAYLVSIPRRRAGKLRLLLTWLKTCCGARTILVAK